MTVLAIAGRELRAFFLAPTGWLVLAGFLFLNGLFFALWVEFYAQAAADFLSNPYASAQMTLTEHLFGPFFANTAVLLLFVCPALSMRLFAEERRNRTLELLLTSPITSAEIVLGKYLGALGAAAALLLGTAYGPALLFAWSTPDPGALAAGYLALLLVAATVLAMGALFSALSSSQLAAMVLTVATALVLYVVGNVGGPGSWTEHIAILPHIDDMVLGAVRVSDLAWFGAVIGFFLFATHQRVESFRWS